jgi:hypothetical protein
VQEGRVKSRSVHKNLNTAYINLSALVRQLQGRKFDGRVHVKLDEYTADIILSPGGEPRVRETDKITGRQTEGRDALERLFVRAEQPGGLINVYENVAEEAHGENELLAIAKSIASESKRSEPSDEENEWVELIQLSGELIATVERAALSMGADFTSIFRAVRLEMADDFPFLDPSDGHFDYASGIVEFRAQPSVSTYVSSVAEAMRRVANKIAVGTRRATIRERIALELAVLARRRPSQLAKFKFTPQLDRIAGTRVL